MTTPQDAYPTITVERFYEFVAWIKAHHGDESLGRAFELAAENELTALCRPDEENRERLVFYRELLACIPIAWAAVEMDHRSGMTLREVYEAAIEIANKKAAGSSAAMPS